MDHDETRHPHAPTPRAGDDVPEVDWNALRARVTAAAALPLAARRRSAHGGSGLRTLLPLAAAAGIAGLAVATLPPRAPAPLTAREQREIDAALRESLPDQVGQLISGAAADQALLEAVDQP